MNAIQRWRKRRELKRRIDELERKLVIVLRYEAVFESRFGKALVGLVSEGRRSPRTGYAVLDEAGAQVGQVTSGGPSPTLGHPIAMAYIAPEHRVPGTRLLVDLRGTREPVEVVALPFYRRPS